MPGNLVHINLLGTRFSIETDEKPEYLQSLIENLDSRLLRLENSTGLQDPLKLSLLAGILLEDEIYKSTVSKNENRKDDDTENRDDLIEAEKLTLNILENIDKTLLD